MVDSVKPPNNHCCERKMNKEEFLTWAIEFRRQHKGKRLECRMLEGHLILLLRLGEITEQDFERIIAADNTLQVEASRAERSDNH